MWILLGIGFLMPFIYFGHLLTKLDKFLKENALSTANNAIHSIAIVLGSTDHAKQIIKQLEKDRIQILLLTEPLLFKQEQNIRYVFALSENDADNIVLCKIAKKLYNIDAIISVCNDRRNEGMFAGEKINYIFTEKATAQQLYQIVFKGTDLKW